MTGERLGPYSKLEPRSTGGRVESFRARMSSPDGKEEAVHLEVLRRAAGAKKERVEALERELSACRELGPERIAVPLRFGLEGKDYVVASPLIEGLTLRELIEEGEKIGAGEVIAIGVEIADALATAHRQDPPLLHGAFSPGCALIGRDGHTTVGGFGLMRLAAELGTSATKDRVDSSAYLSPEQLDGRPATPKSDLFALGACLYEALTGKPPFEGANPIAIAVKISLAQYTPLAKAAPEAPEALRDQITSLLNPNPDKRSSAEELLTTLAELRVGNPGGKALSQRIRDRIGDGEEEGEETAQSHPGGGILLSSGPPKAKSAPFGGPPMLSSSPSPAGPAPSPSPAAEGGASDLYISDEDTFSYDGGGLRREALGIDRTDSHELGPGLGGSSMDVATHAIVLPEAQSTLGHSPGPSTGPSLSPAPGPALGPALSGAQDEEEVRTRMIEIPGARPSSPSSVGGLYADEEETITTLPTGTPAIYGSSPHSGAYATPGPYPPSASSSYPSQPSQLSQPSQPSQLSQPSQPSLAGPPSRPSQPEPARASAAHPRPSSPFAAGGAGGELKLSHLLIFAGAALFFVISAILLLVFLTAG